MNQQIPFSISLIELVSSYLYPKHLNFYLTDKSKRLYKSIKGLRAYSGMNDVKK